MNIRGRIKTGVVVLEEGASLPEGADVVVTCPSPRPVNQPGQRVKLPLVPSAHPGSIGLTGERVADLLNEGLRSTRISILKS